MSRRTGKMRDDMGKLLFAVIVLVGVCGIAEAAATFSVYDDPDVEIQVSFTYTPLDASNARITVWLDNVSAHPEARITGFGFNAPTSALDEIGPLADPFLQYTPDTEGDGSGFVGLIDYSNGAQSGIAADGYGRFDVAAFNGPGGGLNNGDPLTGLVDSATFQFNVTGAGLDLLDEMSFLSLYSAPPKASNGVVSFVVRWQDLDSGSGFAVPEPMTIGLLLIGGVAALLRRRR